MTTKVQKWGNSNAIRIPKPIIKEAHLSENDQVEVKVESGNIIICPIKKHKTLKERIKGYEPQKCSEWDTGSPKGKEIL
ncbi:MAG: AbrB/MazE/SpoVT family DNA-binding domain-containing protein [Thermotogota bacterium]